MPIFPPAFLAPGPFFLHQIATKQDDSEARYQDKKTKVKLALRNGRVGGWRSGTRQVATRQTRQPSTRTRQFWCQIDRLICGHLLYQKNFLNFLAKKIEKIKKKKKHKKCHFLVIFWSQSRQPYTLARQFWCQINHLTYGRLLFKKHF